MPKLAYHLDWLSFSDPGFAPLIDVLDHEWARTTGEAVRPRAGYNCALLLNIGRVDWHSEKTSQRRLWTFTGADCDKLDQLDFGQQELISSVAKVKFAQVTRLDFAADIKGAGAKPDDIERAWMQGKVITKARQMTPIEARDKKGNGQGKTVSIGSRTSGQYLRVYDKGKETRTQEDWCRVELETKGNVAHSLAVQMSRSGIHRMGCAAVRRFVSVPSCDWYTDLLSGAGEFDPQIGRKETNWEAWVKSVALPNVIKAIHEGTPGVREALERVLAQVDSICAGDVH